MRVKGKVQLSTYRMRSFQLQVAEEFLEHVKSLPLQYEKGIYFAFLEDYGTHYTKSGKSGGEYELIYVLNQDTIKAKSMCTPASVPFQNSNFDSHKFSVTRLLKSRCWSIYFMILIDLTERRIQECVKLGIKADFDSMSVTDGKGHYKHDDCGNVTTKTKGLLSLP